MRVLFIGGTGNISGAVSRMAVERGIELVLLNRGRHGAVPGARSLAADYADDAAVEAALGKTTFDAVVNWIAFTPDQVERDERLFALAHAAVRLHLLRLRLREAAPLALHHGVDAPQEPLVAVLAGQDRVRGRARPRLARAGLPGHDRPAEPDLRHAPADRDRGLGLRDPPRPPAQRPPDHRARRRDEPVDGHPRGGLREGLPRPPGSPRRDRRGVPHHLRRGPHLEPDLRHDRGRPRRDRERRARAVRLRPSRGSGDGGRAPRRQGAQRRLRQLEDQAPGARLRGHDPVPRGHPPDDRLVRGRPVALGREARGPRGDGPGPGRVGEAVVACSSGSKSAGSPGRRPPATALPRPSCPLPRATSRPRSGGPSTSGTAAGAATSTDGSAMHPSRRARVSSPPPVRIRRPPLSRRDGSARARPTPRTAAAPGR